jgi:hypothetical protein
MAVAGSDRVSVDAFRRDPLSLAALQGLVDAHHQRISFRHESFHEQPQQDATRLLSGPLRAAQDPMIAAELPFIVQTYCSQG